MYSTQQTWRRRDKTRDKERSHALNGRRRRKSRSRGLVLDRASTERAGGNETTNETSRCICPVVGLVLAPPSLALQYGYTRTVHPRQAEQSGGGNGPCREPLNPNSDPLKSAKRPVRTRTGPRQSPPQTGPILLSKMEEKEIHGDELVISGTPYPISSPEMLGHPSSPSPSSSSSSSCPSKYHVGETDPPAGVTLAVNLAGDQSGPSSILNKHHNCCSTNDTAAGDAVINQQERQQPLLQPPQHAASSSGMYNLFPLVLSGPVL
ncbi:hypothetical protein V8F33_007417 [Rhypophila sp. PSN 637]